MHRPLVYKGDGNVQIMSVVEFENLACNVLEYMATVTNGIGAISNAAISGNSITIGTFQDQTYTNETGQPGSLFTRQNIVLYQEFAANALPESTPPSILAYDYSSNTARVMSSVEMNQIAANIVNYLVTSEGPFSYRLSNTVPSSGTWVIRGSLSEYANANFRGNVVHLYQKLTANTYTLQKPLKASSANSIQRFNVNEIRSLARLVRQRIYSSNIGEYRFQATVPATGTWVSVGTITDFVASTTTQTYSGSWTGSPTYIVYPGATYTGSWNQTYNFGPWSPVYGGSWTPTYNFGPWSPVYTGAFQPVYFGPTWGGFTGATFGPITPNPPSYGPAIPNPDSYGPPVPNPPSYGPAIPNPDSYGPPVPNPPSYGPPDYLVYPAPTYSGSWSGNVINNPANPPFTSTIKTFNLWRRIA